MDVWLNDGELAMAAVFAHALPALQRRVRTRPVRSARLAIPAPVSPLEQQCIREIRRHARRLAALSSAVGRRLGLAEADLRVLRLGCLLHDVGKTAIPPQVLLKCGRLDADEFAAVKYHPIIGDLLCAQAPALAAVRPIVRHHHERLDGSGYPDGLKGDEIPLQAQIVGVVDVYDALVHARPYKPAYDPDHALAILEREVQLGWRREYLVDALAAVVRSGDADWLSTVAAV